MVPGEKSEPVSSETALLILDAQRNMFDDEMPVFQGSRILTTIHALAIRARASGAAVIYLRNDGGQGQPDERGIPGWEIHPSIAPHAGDLVVDKKSPDGFLGTELKKELEQRNVQKLVIAGMQTEYCIDATSRRAAQLGYEVILVEDGHTTFDFEKMTAAEAISRYNAELGSILTVTKSSEIEFG
jgi:nicotinamidase-related amidase